MRIDANQQAQQAANSERAGNQPAASANPAAAAGGSSILGEDQAQLSGFHAQVQSLVAQLSGLPETTQAKVNALREAVGSGKYHVNPEQVAGALFSNMVVKLAA
ncbi:MAG: flagellar biosynthesis anti-sigma factor FlgM [Candidatus Sulfotelmatobacter sp.]